MSKNEFHIKWCRFLFERKWIRIEFSTDFNKYILFHLFNLQINFEDWHNFHPQKGHTHTYYGFGVRVMVLSVTLWVTIRPVIIKHKNNK
jgi:hypothetical protein